jgi:aminopeptidase YwaD
MKINPDEIRRHVDALAGGVGPRVAGSEAEAQAADYVAGQFRAAGAEVEEEPFDFPGFAVRGAKLEVYGHDARSVRGVPLMFCGAAPPEGIKGDAILFRGGDPARYAGWIVLARVGAAGEPYSTAGKTRAYLEAARWATQARAAALILFPREGPAFAVSLDPAAAPPPAFSISAAEGQDLLLALARRERLQVHLRLDAGAQPMRSRNVIARIRGGHGPSRRIVFAAHTDTQIGAPGGNDNAAGLAALIEIARLAAARPLRVTVECIAFGAEEPYPFGHGSRAHVARHEASLPGTLAVLNFDQIGVGGRWDDRPCLKNLVLFDGREWRTTEWLEERIVIAGARLGHRVEPIASPSINGDHAPFLARGVPAAFLRWMDDPWYHSPEDVAANVSPRRVATMAEIALAVGQELA